MTKFEREDLDRRSMTKKILNLGWPTMLEQLLQTAVQYIDTAMVGALGTHAVAAVGATTTVNWLVGSTISAAGIGFLAYISQQLGAGRPDEARRASGQAALCVLVIGSLVTVLTTLLSGLVPVWMQVDESVRADASQYFLILYLPSLFRTAAILFGMVLRASGDTKTPMKVNMVVNIINIVLNFFLISPSRQVRLGGLSLWLPGAGAGIHGAAAASALAFLYGGWAITRCLWHHELISPRGQRLLPDASILRPCLRVSLPNMLQRFATSFGYVAFASMINSLGELSTAAHTVANTVESAFYIPGWGMQTAAATLAGNYWGARDREGLRSLIRTIVPIEIAFMTASGLLLFIFAPSLVPIFSKDPEVISLGVTVLRMVAISEPFYGVPIVLEGILQGMGRTIAPFIYNVSGMWLVRIGGTFLCTRLFSLGLVSAWGCMIAHNLLLFVLFLTHYAMFTVKDLKREHAMS